MQKRLKNTALEIENETFECIAVLPINIHNCTERTLMQSTAEILSPECIENGISR